MANEAVLRGFDMTVSDIGDQLHFRLPLLSFRSSPTLYVAGRVDWHADRQALTIVDDPEDREMATLLPDGVGQAIASGQGVIVAGAEFFHAASLVGGQLDGFSRLSREDCEYRIRIATPEEFVALKGDLVAESRAVFDRELGKASRQGGPLTEHGNAAIRVLRRCGPLRRDDLAIRQLAAALQNQDLDLYRRLLTRFEHELGEPEDHLDKQARRHIDLADAPEGVWSWLNKPASKAELVYEFERLTQGAVFDLNSIPIASSLSKDQPFFSSFHKWQAALLRDLATEGKEKPTRDILYRRGMETLATDSKSVTKSGWEGTWGQAQSA